LIYEVLSKDIAKYPNDKLTIKSLNNILPLGDNSQEEIDSLTQSSRLNYSKYMQNPKQEITSKFDHRKNQPFQNLDVEDDEYDANFISTRVKHTKNLLSENKFISDSRSESNYKSPGKISSTYNIAKVHYPQESGEKLTKNDFNGRKYLHNFDFITTPSATQTPLVTQVPSSSHPHHSNHPQSIPSTPSIPEEVATLSQNLKHKHKFPSPSPSHPKPQNPIPPYSSAGVGTQVFDNRPFVVTTDYEELLDHQLRSLQ